MFECKYLFIVVNIGRAITAQTVKEALGGVLSRNVSLGIERVVRYTKVGVICTHSDVRFSNYCFYWC